MAASLLMLLQHASDLPFREPSLLPLLPTESSSNRRHPEGPRHNPNGLASQADLHLRDPGMDEDGVVSRTERHAASNAGRP